MLSAAAVSPQISSISSPLPIKRPKTRSKGLSARCHSLTSTIRVGRPAGRPRTSYLFSSSLSVQKPLAEAVNQMKPARTLMQISNQVVFQTYPRTERLTNRKLYRRVSIRAWPATNTPQAAKNPTGSSESRTCSTGTTCGRCLWPQCQI